MRSAIRSLRRRPAFALAAILTVALGVGANTALFGVIYTVLIQPLPFRDPGKLVRIWETHPALPQLQVTAPDFRDWRAQTRSFDAMAAHTLSAMNTATLLGQGQPEIVHGTMATSNLFPIMGIQPIVGRNFSDAEERAKQQVAVISESLWRRKFAADPAIVGKQIRLGSTMTPSSRSPSWESYRSARLFPSGPTFGCRSRCWSPTFRTAANFIRSKWWRA